MSRAVSLHIGVNRPPGRMAGYSLNRSEDYAWRMAVLAHQAGYDSLSVLRGETATRPAVHQALTSAAGVLREGDSLLVTFSGHGTREPDRDREEFDGADEGWFLSDGVLLDDKLAGYWRLFDRGVRIVIVSDSCYSGGMDRDDEDPWESPGTAYDAPPRWGGPRGRAPVYRDDTSPAAAASPVRSCIGAPPRESLGIRASVLLLTASSKEQRARETVFSDALLNAWDDGGFRGNYCELHQRIRGQVMAQCEQHPQIMMAGSGDPAFALETAFHVNRDGYGRGGYRS